MQKFFLPLIFLLFLAGPSLANLRPADEVLLQAGSLSNLLSDSSLLEEYYEKLVDHFGGEKKFPRKSFDQIITQLRASILMFPELEARLWESTRLGEPFTITSSIDDFGLELRKRNFEKYWANQIHTLKNKAGSFSEFSNSDLGTKLADFWSSVKIENEKKLNEIESDLFIRKDEKNLKKSALFKEINTRTELEESAAALLKNYYSRTDVRNILEGEDPNIIIDLFRSLRDRPGRVLSAAGLDGSEIPGISGKIKSLILDHTELQKNKTLFAKKFLKTREGKNIYVGKTATGAYEFIPIPRRIHGIFKGVVLKECVGGSCEHSASLTPERWGTIALTDAQLYSVERGSSYLGFIQIVPIQNRKTGEIVGSVDFGSSAFDGGLYIENKTEGITSSKNLFQAWLEQAQAIKPKEWKALVVGESTAVNNANMLELVHSSVEYQAGEILGSSKNFSHLDRFATELIKVSKKIAGPSSYSYGGRMIFDGMVSEAGRLHELVPIDEKGLESEFIKNFGNSDFALESTWKRFFESKYAKLNLKFAIDRAGASVLVIPGLFQKLFCFAYDPKIDHFDDAWAEKIKNALSARVFSENTPIESKVIARRFLAKRLFSLMESGKIWGEGKTPFDRELETSIDSTKLNQWFFSVRTPDVETDRMISNFFDAYVVSPNDFDTFTRFRERFLNLDDVELIDSKSFLKAVKTIFVPNRRNHSSSSNFLDLYRDQDDLSKIISILKKYKNKYGIGFSNLIFELMSPTYFSHFISNHLTGLKPETPEHGKTLKLVLQLFLTISPEAERTKIYEPVFKMLYDFPETAIFFPSFRRFLNKFPPKRPPEIRPLEKARDRLKLVSSKLDLQKNLKNFEHDHDYRYKNIELSIQNLEILIQELSSYRCKNILNSK